jgi:maleate cis-trans isomerase
VVERMTTAILADFPVVSGHFSRLEVVGSTDAYKDDYDWNGMMRAADLLSHADPDVICWNGSKSGSIGLAIILYCTNFSGAHLVAEMVTAIGVPIYDSVSACVWKCLRLIGEPTSPGGRWGSLFTDKRYG